tara:strand:+ start:658 stop:1533 length:876 start_codon:yes stop_codon:yes gene_type:complete
MPFHCPTGCEKWIVETLSDAAKGVADSVINGDAFQNPFSENLDAASALLTGEGGVGGQIQNLLELAGDTPLGESLEGLQELLGTVEGGGLLAQLNEFQQHSNLMSGVGSLTDFSERIGMGLALDSAKQQLGLGEAGFCDMFGVFKNGDILMDNITSQLGLLSNTLLGGFEDLANIDLDEINLLSVGISAFGGDIIDQIAADNSVFADAKILVEKLAIASMITTDNCYIKDLVEGMIGTDGLNAFLPTAIQEQFDDPQQLSEEELQLETERLKSSGIKSDAIAEILAKLGNN